MLTAGGDPAAGQGHIAYCGRHWLVRNAREFEAALPIPVNFVAHGIEGEVADADLLPQFERLHGDQLEQRRTDAASSAIISNTKSRHLYAWGAAVVPGRVDLAVFQTDGVGEECAIADDFARAIANQIGTREADLLIAGGRAVGEICADLVGVVGCLATKAPEKESRGHRFDGERRRRRCHSARRFSLFLSALDPHKLRTAGGNRMFVRGASRFVRCYIGTHVRPDPARIYTPRYRGRFNRLRHCSSSSSAWLHRNGRLFIGTHNKCAVASASRSRHSPR